MQISRREYLCMPVRLSDYYPGSISDRPWLNDNTQAVNRHRVLFDESESTSWFFPNVHIQPMNDGTLATAVLYIASRFVEIGADKPREFYERIAIANYGKYTKETEHQENIRTGKGNYGSDTNTDYTQMSIKKARECLQESHPFLKIDLEILRPEIIILPEKLYYRDRKYFDEIANAVNAKIIGIYQMGPTPINCTIPKYYAPKDFQALHPTVKEWTAQIKRVSQKKYLSVFTYLDHILEHDLYDVE